MDDLEEKSSLQHILFCISACQTIARHAPKGRVNYWIYVCFITIIFIAGILSSSHDRVQGATVADPAARLHILGRQSDPIVPVPRDPRGAGTIPITATPTPTTPTPTAPTYADSDFDGISDSVECNWAAVCPDTDGDGLADHVDIDSDNDGIADWIEAVVVASGRGDFDPVDIDGDRVPDYRDGDSDNDAVPDSVEGHDVDQNGVADRLAQRSDTDQDGLDDTFDLLESGHSVENALATWIPRPNPHGGLPNWRNRDDDGDGLLTIVEVGRDRSFPVDDDQNGVPNYLQPNAVQLVYLPLIIR